MVEIILFYIFKKQYFQTLKCRFSKEVVSDSGLATLVLENQRPSIDRLTATRKLSMYWYFDIFFTSLLASRAKSCVAENSK